MKQHALMLLPEFYNALCVRESSVKTSSLYLSLSIYLYHCHTKVGIWSN